MGIPRDFNHIIQKHLKAQAAWLPITNTYQLGDYGVMSDGVFQKMGNVGEFDVSLNQAEGPDASINFVSASTRVVQLVGNAEVDVIPQGAVGAKLSYKFQKAQSFLVKAAVIKVAQVENVRQVASQLRARPDWRRGWRVVWQTYHAQDPIVFSTLSDGTDVSFSGEGKALQIIQGGSFAAGVQMSVNRELGLQVLGKAGIIALGLFKLKQWGGEPGFLSESAPAGEDADLEFHEDWDADPEDDV